MKTRSSLTKNWSILMFAVATMITACGGPAAAVGDDPRPGDAAVEPTVSPSPAVGLDPTPAPSAPVAPAPPSGVGKPVPPAPKKPATWSKANVVFSGMCGSPVATVDGSGRYHVAASCGSNVRYATSSDGRRWSAKTFRAPLHRLEVDPELAVDGQTLYLAYTRLRPTDGGCGDDGLQDVGVYYRTRHLPSGAWSAPERVGSTGDHLQAFRVKDGAVHETFVSGDGTGPVWYGTQTGSTFHRIRIPGATETDLRVGDDGLARIAYAAGHAVRYAVVKPDGTLDATTIFRSADMAMTSPVLVLGAQNSAYVSWAAHAPWGEGCADGDPPQSKPGAYFATDASGWWGVKRLTSYVGSAALVVDVASGRVHAVFRDSKGYRYATRSASGTWTGTKLRTLTDLDAVTLRRDVATGDLLLVGTIWREATSRNDVVAMTRS
jgi:hypothetical protein